MKPLSILVGFLLAGALALCSQRFGESMPQVAKGDGALSVVFGDARETISRAMVEKANNYFHGGVVIDCDHHHDHDCEGEGCHHDHHHESTDSEGIHAEHSNTLPRDPWRWINLHIRAPEIDRHLEDEKAVEMMPWFWAAVKSDPHNVDAWTTAFYIASTSMRDDALSRRVLDEAKSKNPNSLEILLAEGRFVYRKGAGDFNAAEKIFSKVRDMALARCNNDPEQLTENDRWMYKFALNYLKDIEINRGEAVPALP